MSVLLTGPDQAGICSRKGWFGVLVGNSSLSYFDSQCEEAFFMRSSQYVTLMPPARVYSQRPGWTF